MKRIAIFASGEGSNAETIIRFFKNHKSICVELVLSDKEHAAVLLKAKNLKIETRYFSREEFYMSDVILNLLVIKKIDLIVLAGFLKLVPASIIKAFNGKIINIHPALLPKFGGKNMYGMSVHKAVYDAKEKETGITIHYVNEKLDEGEIIFQHRIALAANETVETIMQKVRALELKFYPEVIERLLDT